MTHRPSRVDHSANAPSSCQVPTQERSAVFEPLLQSSGATAVCRPAIYGTMQHSTSLTLISIDFPHLCRDLCVIPLKRLFPQPVILMQFKWYMQFIVCRFKQRPRTVPYFVYMVLDTGIWVSQTLALHVWKHCYVYGLSLNANGEVPRI